MKRIVRRHAIVAMRGGGKRRRILLVRIRSDAASRENAGLRDRIDLDGKAANCAWNASAGVCE